ncbi:hypothetical protein F4859DRAFT_30750 [Xylaria cf. heliscus]|nr:hypothetical protein F4859DRAFT_30750 [Xylaria cf. heliscus]
MPTMQLPRVKLGFLKKLLPRKPDDAAVLEAATNSGADTQQDEKAAVRVVPLEECPICHDPVGVKNPEGILESWVHLHCNHKFGTHCIQTWLQESAERDPHSVPSCPICRTTAKHPCGHPVVLPARRLPPITVWSSMLPVPPGLPSPTHIEGHRPRRRLSRRWGHPLRPLPPRPGRAYVQTVGECTTCAAAAAAAAAQETRMKQSASTSIEAGASAYAGRGRTHDRRTGIKSMLLQTSFRGRSTSTSEAAREDYSAFLGVFGERAPPPARPLTIPRRDSLNLSLTAHRDSLTLCRTDVGVPRSPTPIPPAAHVLSTRMELAHI